MLATHVRMAIYINIYTPPTLPLYSHDVKSLSTLFFYNVAIFQQGMAHTKVSSYLVHQVFSWCK